MTVFLDCDGVLADFDAHYERMTGVRPDPSKPEPDDFWKKLSVHPTFYRDLPLMADAWKLMSGVLDRGFSPIILTGIPSSVADASTQKIEWVQEHFTEVPGLRVITCYSRDKSKYGSRGDVLIDDRPRYRGLWEKMGGIWITHTSAANSLAELDMVVSQYKGESRNEQHD